MKDNKNKIIYIMLFLIIILAILYFVVLRNRITFKLVGEDNITVEFGMPYIDSGYIAKKGLGTSLNDYVKVINNVDTSQTGAYKVVYTLNYNGEVKELSRMVLVSDYDVNNYKLEVNGEENISVIKDSIYEDKGASIIDKASGKKLDSVIPNMVDNVDTSKIGVYEVEYSFSHNGKTISAKRMVNVFDVENWLEPNGMTEGKVKICLNLDSLKNYSYTKLPDGYTSLNKEIEYEVSSNGKYTFTIVLQNQEEYKKDIVVDTIVGKYTCSGEITNTGTKLEVGPTSSEIVGYEWKIKGESVSGTNTFEKKQIISEAKVNLVFSNNKKYEVNCNITDKLLYHFKYDETNSKPFMKCDTYTEQDRIKYDALLKQVVAEAGYGTRAGVVAAARFLVGGLDYKVPYKGAQRYDKVGLNIGQKGAWGCSSSGLDCFYFVYWALSQNGLPLGALYAGTKYDTISEVNNIKLGDYLLTPCNSATCKNIYSINHIGLVIGIDDRYIYVAEETTGNINALVVTKLDKANLPRSGKFSKVKHESYPAEGNISEMWLSE